MTDRIAIFAAACVVVSVAGIATALKARADYEAMGPQVDETIQRANVFQHQACPDCIVMRVNFVPPKP